MRPTRSSSEAGFTLIEVLVVVLIVGILAAIALPTFLGQSDKAKDASAKSAARNAVSQMDACLTGDTVLHCIDNRAEGQLDELRDVSVVSAGTYYRVTARSSTDATYSITKTRPGFDYTSSPDASGGEAWADNSS